MCRPSPPPRLYLVCRFPERLSSVDGVENVTDSGSGRRPGRLTSAGTAPVTALRLMSPAAVRGRDWTVVPGAPFEMTATEEGEERRGREGGGETGWSVCEDLDGIEAFKNRSCVWDPRTRCSGQDRRYGRRFRTTSFLNIK